MTKKYIILIKLISIISLHHTNTIIIIIINITTKINTIKITQISMA